MKTCLLYQAFRTGIRCAAMLALGLSIGGSIADAQELKLQPKKLKYGWKPNQNCGYEFDATFDADGKSIQSKGFVTYRLEQSNVARDFDGDAFPTIDEGEATSTAFAVTADGYLLTL